MTGRSRSKSRSIRGVESEENHFRMGRETDEMSWPTDSPLSSSFSSVLDFCEYSLLFKASAVDPTKAQPSSEPFTMAGWLMMGPRPFAPLTFQAKKAIKPIGVTKDLRVKKCRSFSGEMRTMGA